MEVWAGLQGTSKCSSPRSTSAALSKFIGLLEDSYNTVSPSSTLRNQSGALGVMSEAGTCTKRTPNQAIDNLD